MIKLSVRDSSALTRLAQYKQLSAEDKARILADTDTEDARQIGRILLDESVQASPEIQETARVLRAWAEANRRDMEGRMQALKQREMV